MTPTVPAWVRDAVFYQIFPDRFARSARLAPAGPFEPWDAQPTPHGFKGGDLFGIAERLDELVDLGVTALYLTPIFTSASNHRYHTDDYLAVDPLLGGDAALRALVDALHARGMRLVLDGVFNHTGRGFWPFHHIVENGLQSPYLDWFHVDRRRLAAGHGLQPYPGRGGAKGESRGYRAWANLPALPKLDTGHPPVREYLWGVAEHWLRFGIDGWRLDVPAEIADPAFWREFRRRCRAVNPECYLVGEIWHVAPEWLAGDRFDALMNYPLLEAILAFVASPMASGTVPLRMLEPGSPELEEDGPVALVSRLRRQQAELERRPRRDSAETFAARLRKLLGAYAPANVAAQLNLLSSHDIPRFRTLAGGDAGALLLGTLLQMSLPGAPCIYYGDEIGMEGGPDPDCRRTFPVGPAGRDEALRASVRALVAARAASPALRSDRVEVVAAEGEVLALLRGGTGDPGARGDVAIVAVNVGDAPVTIAAPVPELAGARLAPVASVGTVGVPLALEVGEGGAWVMELPARAGVVLRRE
jgi:cyclomaltodextrinase / maltogenic alpha-amylase / neopullulanase